MPGRPVKARVNVTTLHSTPIDANVHVVDCGDAVLVVDTGTGADAAALTSRIDELVGLHRVTHVYLTHWHADHVGGAAQFKRATDARMLIHDAEARAVRDGDATATLGAMIGLPQAPCPVDTVKEGDTLRVGDREFQVLLVPGHSPAHTALWDPESRSLFSGDVVFAHGSFGRVDFPGCDPAALIRSIEKLSKLDAVNLYAGHMENLEGNAGEGIAWSLKNARSMIGGE
jgi:hydroxyacylglutathione hydrolase